MGQEGSERFEAGMRRFSEVTGDYARQTVEQLESVAPDLGRYVVEWAYADVYSRPGLGLRERQISTVSMLTALGATEPQLEVHLTAALRAGVSPGELAELLIHAAPFVGLPRTLNAAGVLRRVLERDEDGSG